MSESNLSPNIAFFDSGQGGLTIWENVLKKFPNLNTQYMGDNARCPYGNKSNETIIQFTKEALSFLGSRQASLAVVACGTASSVAVKSLQNKYSFPVIGIVEGFCQHVADMMVNKSRPVGVLATRYTIKSKRFVEELASHGMHHVWDRACPLFVPLIEEGIATGSLVETACDMYLWDVPKDIKIIMLACTHYPRIVLPIAESLERLTGRSVILKKTDGDWLLKLGKEKRDDPIFLVDASSSIIQYISNFLSKNNTPSQNYFLQEQTVLCTDSPEQFEKAARYFTSHPLKKVLMANITSTEKTFI